MAKKMLFTRLQKKRQRVDPQTLMDLKEDSAARVARLYESHLKLVEKGSPCPILPPK